MLFRSLLRARGWNFCTTAAGLSEVSSTEATTACDVYDYAHAWALPSDHLAILKVNGIEGGTSRSYWKVASGMLFTDGSEANVEYVRDSTDCTEWEDDFAEAMSWFLAAAIAPSITGDAKIGMSLLAHAKESLGNAASADTHEGKVPVLNKLSGSPYAQARRGFGSSYAEYLIGAAAYRDYNGL